MKPDVEVYVGMCADIVHAGHINILKLAAKYGRVTVGLITDEAIALYKQPPAVPFESRKALLEAIRYVDEVVPQITPSPVGQLLELRPKYFVHGDDWRKGPLRRTRDEVIEALKSWGGELIETPYTLGVSSSLIKLRISQSSEVSLVEIRHSASEQTSNIYNNANNQRKS